MSTYYTHHPKRAKNCVFCKYWIGDAEKQFINSIVGYKYNASYVICGEKPGSKLTKARELGIPVLTEQEFLSMIPA